METYYGHLQVGTSSTIIEVHGNDIFYRALIITGTNRCGNVTYHHRFFRHFFFISSGLYVMKAICILNAFGEVEVNISLKDQYPPHQITIEEKNPVKWLMEVSTDENNQ
jgi:hypothetical protein